MSPAVLAGGASARFDIINNMANSKNIRVLDDWFRGIDNKTVAEHKKLCEFLYEKVQPNTWQWSSDKTSFWVEQKSSYYTYYMDDGLKTPRQFNLPVKIDGIVFDIQKNSATTFPEGQIRVKGISEKNLGKIHGSESNRTYSGEIDPYYFNQAKQELQENPIPQASFDWDVVKQAVEEG